MVVAVAVVRHDEVICLNQFFKRKLILIKIMKEGERERVLVGITLFDAHY